MEITFDVDFVILYGSLEITASFTFVKYFEGIFIKKDIA
jgi:hypothetical protein